MPSFVTQKLFGEDMLQHTFIFFTKCEGYFKSSKYEHLGQYLESLKKSPLGGALKVIGDKAIGVESHCEGYQKMLSRQAIVDLLRTSLNEAQHDCYTHALFHEAKQKYDNELQRKETATNILREEVKDLVSSELSGIADMRQLCKVAEEGGKELVGTILNKARTKIDGMMPVEQDNLVKSVIVTSIKYLTIEQLRRKIAVIAEQCTTDPKGSIDSYVGCLKERYPFVFQYIEERYVGSIIGTKLLELQGQQALIEKKQKITQFILKHIHLHSNTNEIQRLMSIENPIFGGRNTKMLIEQCLDLDEVRVCIHSYQEREACKIVRKYARNEIQELICDKTRSELYAIVNDRYQKAGRVVLMKKDLKEQHPMVSDYFGDEEISKMIEDILVVTTTNVTDADFGQRVTMFFSPIFGKEHVKDVMGEYVAKA